MIAIKMRQIARFVFYSRMNFFIVGLAIVVCLITGCATTPTVKHTINITTSPSNALVCIASVDKNPDADPQAVAGPTPLSKNFVFGSQNQLWLQIEKRGYKPQRISVTPDSGNIHLDLDRLIQADGSPAPEFRFPLIKKMVLLPLDFSVIERGFSSESVSAEASSYATEALKGEIFSAFKNKWEMITIAEDHANSSLLKALYRDGQTIMALVNPIRLQYLPEPLLLETTSARKAAQAIGRQYGAQTILIVQGKQIVENAAMIAGKVGMTVIGTASSYAGGYSRAVANGDSFFSYTVYTPYFSEGANLKALLIDCQKGEIIWTNQGLWKPIPFSNTQIVSKVVVDLFSGIFNE